MDGSPAISRDELFKLIENKSYYILSGYGFIKGEKIVQYVGLFKKSKDETGNKTPSTLFFSEKFKQRIIDIMKFHYPSQANKKEIEALDIKIDKCELLENPNQLNGWSGIEQISFLKRNQTFSIGYH